MGKVVWCGKCNIFVKHAVLLMFVGAVRLALTTQLLFDDGGNTKHKTCWNEKWTCKTVSFLHLKNSCSGEFIGQPRRKFLPWSHLLTFLIGVLISGFNAYASWFCTPIFLSSFFFFYNSDDKRSGYGLKYQNCIPKSTVLFRSYLSSRTAPHNLIETHFSQALL